MAFPPAKPASAVSGWTGMIGMATLFGVVAALKFLPAPLSTTEEIFFLLGLPITTMALFDIMVVKVHRQPDAGLVWQNFFKRLAGSFLDRDLYVKIVGVGLSVLFLVFVWSAQLYKGAFYEPYFNFIKLYFWLIVGIGVLYFFVVNAVMEKRRDGSWHLAAFFIPWLHKQADRDIIKTHIVSLCVKIFFLPLMFVYLSGQWSTMRGINALPKDFPEFFSLSMNGIFFLDVVFGVIGYICTFRLFNAHIRKPETRWGGWVMCLICYAPFNQVIFNEFLNYHDSVDWKIWLSAHPSIYAVWGSLLIASYTIYVLATVNFGLRFSNLTNRGILTHGMYAYTKHPAYISKNFSWWLEDVPFIATSLTIGLKHSAILFTVNIIYYMRAKYEEKLLSEQDDTYRQYADYIREYGIFARVGRFWNKFHLPKRAPAV